MIPGLTGYLPQDRLASLARGEPGLPDRAAGAAVFADISGFTPLAEALAVALGPRRGPEELTRQLNCIYDVVIREVERFGGSVILFSGDAMTCWLDGDDGRRGAGAALAMQAAMQQFAAVALPNGCTVALAMKVGLATGAVRRFVVGDPGVQLLDVIAGDTLARMTAAQGVARKHEVVMDATSAAALAGLVEVADWRGAGGQRFAVIHRLTRAVVAPPPVPLATEALVEPGRLRPWLLPPVYQRLEARQGEFLTELRPAVVCFIQFAGIDYDGDEGAGDKLDRYVRWVQRRLAEYDGYLLGLTIGDKGSYLYGAFGVPISHEDDLRRALLAGHELRKLPPELGGVREVRLGLSAGTVYAGSYGGTTRRTYGILGDEVNLAARLMQQAAPGQLLASSTVRKRAPADFAWQSFPPIRLKGKAAPVPVFALLGVGQVAAGRLHEPVYALPMVGRTAERTLIEEQLAVARAGRGRIVNLVAEAGTGKSRLAAEVLRHAQAQGVPALVGQCQSYGMDTSYLAWWSIWQAWFGLRENQSPAAQIALLEAALREVNPEAVARLPLLAAVTQVPLPDNDLTRSFDPQLRKASLEALLLDCLRHRARREPLFLLIEDGHWMDALSRELLEAVARMIAGLPVFILLTSRPNDPPSPPREALSVLPGFTEVRLARFAVAEATQLITLKLRRLFGESSIAPPALVERLVARADGNPFYIEELLDYLNECGLKLDQPATWEQLELPSSLHSLILTRIDQLTENQKAALKVASVIGRLFRAAMIWGAHPELGDPARVRGDLEALRRLELTALDAPEPELVYLFKHVVTQEVAYESLPFATRARLHAQIGRYLETVFAGELAQQLDLLAFHYGRSGDEAKARQYLRQAGEAAQGQYANAAAIEYYRRLLPLVSGGGKVDVLLRLGQVLEHVGNWSEVAGLFGEGLAISQSAGDSQRAAQCRHALGDLLRKQGRYAEASQWFAEAQSGFAALADQAGEAQVLHGVGTLAAQQGDYAQARESYEASLAIRTRQHDRPRIASLLSNLGILGQFNGDFLQARMLHEEALRLRRELGDRWAIANSLNNLALVLRDLGDPAGARALLEESVALNRQVGDRWATANALNSLADVAADQQDFATVLTSLEASLAVNRELGDHRALAFLLESFARMGALQGHAAGALRLAAAAAALRESIGAPLSPAETARQNQWLEAAGAGLSPESRAALWAQGRALDLDAAATYALSQVGAGPEVSPSRP